MARTTWGRGWKYRLEKGSPHAIGFAVLVALVLAMFATAAVILYVAGEFDSLSKALWWSFLRLSDTGYVGEDDNPTRRAVALVLWTGNLLCIGALLVAGTTSFVNRRLAELRDGGFDIAFRDHTVVVGWSDKVFMVVEELLEGNPDGLVAILGSVPKAEAEDLLERRVFSRARTNTQGAVENSEEKGPFSRLRNSFADAIRRKDPRRQVVYRCGSPRITRDLERVSSEHAKTFIYLSPDTDPVRPALEGPLSVAAADPEDSLPFNALVAELRLSSDVTMLRNMMSVLSFYRRKGDPKPNASKADRTGLSLAPEDRVLNRKADAKLTSVVEVSDDRFRTHTFLAAELDPRSDSWVNNDLHAQKLPKSLPKPDSSHIRLHEELVLVNSDELVSRAVVQAAIQPRLGAVFEQLLSFHGKDFFVFDPFDAKGQSTSPSPYWNKLVARAQGMNANELTATLATEISGGLICGRYRNVDDASDTGSTATTEPTNGRTLDQDRVQFGPEKIQEDFGKWPLVVLGSGPLVPRARRSASPKAPAPSPAGADRTPRSGPAEESTRDYRVLILGHNRRVPILIEQFAAYTNQYKWLNLHLTFVDPDIDTDMVHATARREFKVGKDNVDVVQGDYADWTLLGRVLNIQQKGQTIPAPGATNPVELTRSFDSIVLLADDSTLAAERADARVTLGVVMLRAFRQDPRFKGLLQGTSVVAEMMDPQNAEIVMSDDLIQDVIVSNQYVSRFIAQVALDYRTEDIYRQLLDYGGREIYERAPIEDYAEINKPFAFLQAVRAAAERGATAIGYLRPHNNPSKVGKVDVQLAPEPSDNMADAVSLLVIADN